MNIIENELLYQTGFRTNFFDSDLPFYEQAIKEYGDKTIRIGKGTHGSNFALYHDVPGDLSDFWKIFDRIKGRV